MRANFEQKFVNINFFFNPNCNKIMSKKPEVLYIFYSDFGTQMLKWHNYKEKKILKNYSLGTNP